jgi:hypothetical protein
LHDHDAPDSLAGVVGFLHEQVGKSPQKVASTELENRFRKLSHEIPPKVKQVGSRSLAKGDWFRRHGQSYPPIIVVLMLLAIRARELAIVQQIRELKVS